MRLHPWSSKPSQAKPSIDTYKEVAISLTNSVCYGVQAAFNSAIAAFDLRTYLNSLRFLDSSSEQVRDVLDVALGLESFENTFPKLNQIVSNPREWWDGEVRKTEGTYLDYGAWATQPLKVFDSLAISFGTALPQAAVMAYGMAPTIASAGPTVGEFLVDTKTLGSALGKSVVRTADNIASKMLPPPPPALAMAGGGVMAMPISGEVGEAVVVGGIRATGSAMQGPEPLTILAMGVVEGVFSALENNASDRELNTSDSELNNTSDSELEDRMRHMPDYTQFMLEKEAKIEGTIFPKGTTIEVIRGKASRAWIPGIYKGSVTICRKLYISFGDF